MTYLFKQLGRANPKRGLFGLEMELEGTRLPKEGVGNWRAVREDSLRDGGKEYISKVPRSYNKALEDVSDLHHFLINGGSEVRLSVRTSTHVHVNMQDLTFNEMTAFLFISYLIEPLLYKYCAKSRHINQFCLTGMDAEGCYGLFEELLQVGDIRCMKEQQRMRYGFINPVSLSKFGTVEFRGLQGTLDTEILAPWLATLRDAKELAKETGDISTLRGWIASNKLGGLLDKVVHPKLRYQGEIVAMKEPYDYLRTLATLHPPKKSVETTQGTDGEKLFIFREYDQEPVDEQPMAIQLEGNPFL